MAFPDAPRMVYGVNPLEEVKCQVKFPTILSIEASIPAQFQDAVRAEFPYFELKSPVKFPTGIPPTVVKSIERDLSLVGSKTYSFTSEDRKWTLALNKDGLSLMCRNYERWEPFRQRLERALQSVMIYKPSFFQHTCVRYKNSIRKSLLGLADAPWSSLLQPWVTGPFDNQGTANGVEAFQTRCIINLDNNTGKVDYTFALGRHEPSKEEAFVVEAHVFNESRKAYDDVLPTLDVLHRQAGLFFRSCIRDKLHQAMRPTTA